MKRTLILLFGIAAYGLFFLTFLYLIAFVGNLQTTGLTGPWLTAVVPYSIDAGRSTGPLGLALLINLGLLLLFGMQHSIMARLGFKDRLKRVLPDPAVRSVYVLTASLCLILLFWQWRPLPGIVWTAESTALQAVAWSVFALGFALVLLSTFLIDHFDLFGLKHVWRQFVGKGPDTPEFVTPMFYRNVRHPMYLGFVLAFWATPVMTVGHMMFAAVLTVYILIAIQLEEKDLVGQLGDAYADYRRRVPMLLPVPGRRYRRVHDG